MKKVSPILLLAIVFLENLSMAQTSLIESDPILNHIYCERILSSFPASNFYKSLFPHSDPTFNSGSEKQMLDKRKFNLLAFDCRYVSKYNEENSVMLEGENFDDREGPKKFFCRSFQVESNYISNSKAVDLHFKKIVTGIAWGCEPY